MYKLTSSSDVATFHANSYVQLLRQEVYPHVPDANWLLKELVNREFLLVEKDHWYNNGILADFTSWSSADRRTALWVGGYSGVQDNWVTEMSVDLIKALESQDKTVIFTFCGEALSQRSFTSISLVEQLIVQLFQAHSLLAFENADRINSRRLRKVETFAQLWSLWESLVAETNEIFIVVDRVDLCCSDEEVSIEEFLSKFFDLVQQHGQISMVLTSSTEPPQELANDGSRLQSSWVKTSISPHRRYDKRY